MDVKLTPGLLSLIFTQWAPGVAARAWGGSTVTEKKLLQNRWASTGLVGKTRLSFSLYSVKAALHFRKECLLSFAAIRCSAMNQAGGKRSCFCVVASCTITFLSTSGMVAPPRPAKSRPCPAPPRPAKLTKSAGSSGAKLTADSIDTPFHYAQK